MAKDAALKELLKLYDKEVKREKKLGYVRVGFVSLTPGFLRACRKRIIDGHKKYGDDWKTKDSMKERNLEVYDYFNYTILARCKKRYEESMPKLRVRRLGR